MVVVVAVVVGGPARSARTRPSSARPSVAGSVRGQIRGGAGRVPMDVHIPPLRPSPPPLGRSPSECASVIKNVV